MIKPRSYGACWTCRIRKIKCDETSIACKRCNSLRITCHGYGKKPAWIDGGQREREETEKIKRKIKETNKVKRLLRNRKNWSSQLDPHTRPSPDITEVLLPRQALIDAKMPCVTNNLSANVESIGSENNNDSEEDGLNERESCILMHYLDFVFPLQFPFYRPHPTEGGRGWLLSLILGIPAFFYTVLSLSEYHIQASTTYDPVSPRDLNILEDIERHYTLALRGLRHHIEDSESTRKTNDKTIQIGSLGCIIQLISFEVSSYYMGLARKSERILMGIKTN
jgi:C6 transcription factor Pro1